MQRSKPFILAAALILAAPMATAQSIPGGGGNNPISSLGGIFGGGSAPAKEKTQLLVHAEALLAAKKRLEMLAGFDLNNSSAIYNAIHNVQSLLGQIEGVLGYDPGTIEAEISARYPMHQNGPLSFDESERRSQEWRDAEMAAIKESQKVQAQVARDMPSSAQRDAQTLDECMATAGIRGSQQCAATIAAASAEETRKVQLLLIAEARAREAERMAVIASKEKADALWCSWSEGKNCK